MRRIVVATAMLLAMVTLSAGSCASCPAGKEPVYSPTTHTTACQ